ncbi:UDP-N-acetylmuramate dehydrogenase [Helicovermis profundi]|uniref:UDP-N-acetylenolpyruvoylglucosamine reductase n=1 Tax=Helicovermis profundi TaxID=3065157 RepID=A0AAU9E545_9FIRM|nr:UDP-N-acetylmuramate dehydrogenase [Clostridia bacterium S502]
MEIESFKTLILNIVASENVYENELLSKHTSFKIGGPAKLLIEPTNIEELIKVVDKCRENNIRFFILGNGSNIIALDQGYDGVIIKISNKLSNVEFIGENVICESGVLLSTLSKMIVEKSLKGFEFASGIPGTLGGAIYMNAGAYDSEMKNVVENVTVIDEIGKVKVLSNDEMKFEYRNSVVQKKGYIVLKVNIKLEKGIKSEIIEKINELTIKRTTKQPLHLPSAGSTFKRPSGYYAGKLIDDAGLRGVKFRGAMISSLHSGFVVNVDNATSYDVFTLIDVVKKTVKDTFDVNLEREVRILGKE